ncbi:hypothetical protein WJX72_001475 [[Myrmecia] bisecta]|uniref:Uncharacterized protein n=1 Tax=[Myrmecia] bisecta TaxID=41462 RepID=A0AAW1QP05_9CHLO
MFEIEQYWVNQFFSRDHSTSLQYVGSLVASLLIGRVDFFLRFVLSQIYGFYQLANGVAERAGLPVLYSLVAYADVQDKRSEPLLLLEGAKAALKTLSAPTSGANIDVTQHSVVQLMVELSWLAYEEAPVIQDALQKDGWVSELGAGSTMVLDFFSTVYEYAEDAGSGRKQNFERPVDTQCLIFKLRDAVFVAFRGSQPVNYFDWAYNFTVSPYPQPAIADNKKVLNANLGSLTSHECLGTHNPYELQQYVDRGFAADLGLTLKDNDGNSINALKCQFALYPDPMVDLAAFNEPIKDTSKTPPENFAHLRTARGSPYQVIKQAVTSLMSSTDRLVVNDNDLVARGFSFFLTDGAAFEHADGQQALKFIDAKGVVSDKSEPIVGFDDMMLSGWRKLRVAWRRMAQRTTPQSSMRFLLRAALTPVLVINDHIDYKWLLRNAGENGRSGYWQTDQTEPKTWLGRLTA